MKRSTPFSNALHLIAHSYGPYWAAAAANTLRGKVGVTAFADALIVKPNGDVCGARGHSWTMSAGDLPPYQARGRRDLVCVY